MPFIRITQSGVYQVDDSGHYRPLDDAAAEAALAHFNASERARIAGQWRRVAHRMLWSFIFALAASAALLIWTCR